MPKKLTKEQIKENLKTKGWTEDRWGSMKKTKNDKLYRFKFKDIVFRYELRVGDSWMRIGGGYYKDYEIVDGKITRKK